MKQERNVVRVSSKGQIVIPKPVREKYGLGRGRKLLIREVEGGILLTVQKSMVDEVREIAEEFRDRWPKDMTSVDIVRRERGKHG